MKVYKGAKDSKRCPNLGVDGEDWKDNSEWFDLDVDFVHVKRTVKK